MHPNEILELANDPAVPKFVFGSAELAAFHRTHLPTGSNRSNGSSLYVVEHRSQDPRIASCRVLSRWNFGYVMPHSWDVPTTEVAA